MKRLQFSAKAGDVVTLRVPLEMGGFFGKRHFKVECQVEVREIKDGRVELVVLGPDGGDPVAER